jgi:predicted secreted acid phosphatase
LDSEESAEESVSLIDAIGFLNYANEQSVVIILENNRNPAAAQSQNSIIKATNRSPAETSGQRSHP